MSDEQRKNLLVRNKADHYPHYVYDDGWLDGRGVESDVRSWSDQVGYDFSCELTPGTYTLTAETDGPDTYLTEFVRIIATSGAYYVSNFPANAGLAQSTTFTLTDETAGTWFVIGKRRGARWRAALFAGTEPAAWAPYVGETLAGGGALMSANLLAEGDLRTGESGTTYADGVWSIPANGTSGDKNAVNDWPTGTEAVTENQTLHVGMSVRAASGASVVVAPGVAYVDGAGNVNYVATRVSARGTGAWQRVEGSFVMPSGMRVLLFFVHQGAGSAALELTAPTLSLGYPVSLAVASHTPYATEGHLKAVYATQASLKVESDRITSEVSARAQTDEVVASHTTSIGQLSDSITSAVSGSTTYTAPDGTQKTNTLATKVSQTATDVTIAIQDASTAVSTAKAAASDAATAKTDAGKASSDAAAAIAETKDLVTLRIDSSRGTVFKNNLVSTVLTVRCYKRGQELTTLEALRQAMLDETARIRWYVLREGDTDWVSLADSDHMLSNDGFTLTVTPDDVSVKCTFKAEIVTD